MEYLLSPEEIKEKSSEELNAILAEQFSFDSFRWQQENGIIAVGGHVDLGESVEIALKREVQEELGITDFTPELLTTYVFESDREKELVFAHKTIYDGEIKPSEELNGGRFWPLKEIRTNMGKGVFTPNFESEFKKLGF